MQAFASIRPQEGAMGMLVMPGLVGVAGFHRRDDMHQAGTVATDNKHPGDDVLLADVVLGNVFDGNASGTRQLGGALAHSIAKRFGKSRIVEDPDLPRRKKSRHSDRKSTRLNSSHSQISYAVFCLKKKKKKHNCFRLSNCHIREMS